MPPSTSSLADGPGRWGPAPTAPPTGPATGPPLLAPPPPAGQPAPPPPDVVGAPAGVGSNGAAPRGRRPATTARNWTRITHVYSSMVALLLVLFFGLTGLTLNHPEWTFGFDPTTTTVEGTLPSGSVGTDGAPDLLTISEHLRAEEHVRGTVTDFGVTGTEGYISYRGPGYVGEATFDAAAGTYRLEVEQQGVVGVLNDLHKGRDTNSSWGWVIDLSAVFLVGIALTGLLLQLLLRKRRTSAVVVAGLGGVVALVVGVTTLF